jgi:hypothetical protein
MPKTRTIVAIAHPKTGEPLAAGAEVDLDEEAYQALRQAGAVEASQQEVREHATPDAQGNYGARTGRSDVAGQPTAASSGGPQDDDEDDDDDKPRSKSKK